MRSKIIMFGFLLGCRFSVFAENPSQRLLSEKNVFQVDTFSLQFEKYTAENSKENENNLLVASAPVSFGLQLHWHHLFFSSHFYSSIKQDRFLGSIFVGKRFESNWELGGSTEVSHQDTMSGEDHDANGILFSHFLIGPYLAYYPWNTEEFYIKLISRLGYEYQRNLLTTNGVTSDASKEYGINLYAQAQTGFHFTEKILYSPSVTLTFRYSDDVGGANTTRKGIGFEILPISFQIEI